MSTTSVLDPIQQAAANGRVCALAASGQRDLARCRSAYPALFPDDPFDATLLSNIALAIAFSEPGAEAEQLRTTNRLVLWGFALDWQVDRLAVDRVELDELLRRQCAVAAGAVPEPGDALGSLLADIRAELAAAPAFAALSGAWQEAVDRTLTAMSREWDWRADPGTAPDLDGYLANADNLACTVVNVAHWIRTGGPEAARHADRLVAASDAVQRALRLVNDLATVDRDVRTGDLNAILLVGDRAVVERHLAGVMTECGELLAGLRPDAPREVDYLSRQLGYTSGFYRSTDFWGVR